MQRSKFFLILSAILCTLAGCGQATSQIDDAPFRQAIEVYLESNNMALAIKEVKQGPIVDGQTAQLQASMTHETLGGPSVTWTFYFEQTGDDWRVTSHDD
jgi:hypothetical protein